MQASSDENTGWRGRLPAVSIDRSSWVSWAMYVLGIEMVRDYGFDADLRTGGPGLMVLAGSIAVFFMLVLLIQRHMRLSLLASTYGDPQQLVTSGPFYLSRNPIYVAFLIPLATLSYYSLIAAMAAMGLYMLVMTYFVIAREEAVLEKAFGATYRDYKARTPRWMYAI